MIGPFLKEVRRVLPLGVVGAEWEDPTLLVNGDHWGLSTTSAWRISTDDSVVVGGWDKDASQAVAGFVGQEIVAVGVQSTRAAVDPVFFFSGGASLEIFSVDVYEPWVVRLPGSVWVASPSDPSSFS